MKTLSIALVVAVTFSACQTKSTKTPDATSIDANTVADSSALLTKRPGADASRSAADRLVRALYFEHNVKENPFREKKDRTVIDQFFTKSTADLIWQDAQRASNKVNREKVNLLFNASDAAIKKTWVEPAAIGGTRAIVYVTFENKGKPEEIKVEMQQIGSRWRIADMVYPDSKHLTDLVK